MKKMFAAALLALAGTAAFADLVVKDGTGTSQTLSDSVIGGKHVPHHMAVDITDTILGTSTNPYYVQFPSAQAVTFSNTTIGVTGTFWQPTQPVSHASLGTPTDPSNCATDSTSVSEVASLKCSVSKLTAIANALAATLTVQGTLTANLGTLNGAATAAKQPALGTAGTPSADIITVQGSPSGTPLPTAPTATENHIGEVGNNLTVLTATPLTTSGLVYTGGNAVGSLMTLTGASRLSGSAGASGTSGSIQSVLIGSKSSQGAMADIIFFNANPTATTCSDRNPFALGAADIGKYIGTAHVTDWSSYGTPSTGQAHNLAMPYSLSSSTTIYACMVIRSGPTYTSTSDLAIAVNVYRN